MVCSIYRIHSQWEGITKQLMFGASRNVLIDEPSPLYWTYIRERIDDVFHVGVTRR